MWLSCPTLTCLHKLQDYEVVSILFPNGRRGKHVLHLSKKKSAWEGFRLRITFVGQRIMGDVEEILKTEILVEKYPEE